MVGRPSPPPTIIGASEHVLDDTATNLGMQGFDEAQAIVTSMAHGVDGGGAIPAGTRVDMRVTEPGDWMHVVTAPPVPAPGALLLAGLGTGRVGHMRCRRGL